MVTGDDLLALLSQVEDPNVPVYVAGEGPVSHAFLATNVETGDTGLLLTRPVPLSALESVPKVPGPTLLEEARRRRSKWGWHPRRNWWDGVFDRKGN